MHSLRAEVVEKLKSAGNLFLAKRLLKKRKIRNPDFVGTFLTQSVFVDILRHFETLLVIYALFYNSKQFHRETVKINIRLVVCSIIHIFESLLTKIFIFSFWFRSKIYWKSKIDTEKKETTWSSGRRKNKQKMIKVNKTIRARERRIDCANKNLQKEKNSFVEKCKLSYELNS